MKISHNIEIPDSAITMKFTSSSGPGGQNVNKVATRVQLFVDIYSIKCLPSYAMERLKKMVANQISKEGVLILSSQKFRSQDRNRSAVLHQLKALINSSLVKPKQRRKTTVSKEKKARRQADNKHHSDLKKLRKKPGID